MKELYYFTNSYPYGIAEEWKKRELEVFVNYFDSVVVIPYWYANNKNPRGYSHNKITYLTPLFPEPVSRTIKQKFIRIIYSKHILFFLLEFFSKKVFLSKDKFIRWVVVSYNILMLKKNQVITSIFSNSGNVTCYFFWGRESAEMIPLIPKKIKVVCKFYNYDLYEDKWGYLPYQKSQMNRSNYLVACSMDNYKYILCKYPHVKTKLVIDLLGTEIPNTVAKQSEDGILRIVSCAFMVSYKRIELLIESLEHINIPIHWTHIGDGPMRKSYEDKMLKLTAVNSKVKYQFTGAIPHNQLISYYISRPIDLFVNTSITEGIPISIMEILSLQVPVVATNVGGVNEIVISDYNGYLVDSMITPFELAQVITKYSNLSKSKKQELSNNARKIVIDKFDCYKCAEDLAQNVFIN